jgi:hypothetical protein
MNTKDKINKKCNDIRDLLLGKNEKYGDSALDPLNIFSGCNASTGIRVRLDDKLKRIANSGLTEDTEDTLIDIAGYIILLIIAKDNERNNIQERKTQQGATSHTARNCTLSYPTGDIQGSDT